MLFFMLIARGRWLFWDWNSDTNMYRWVWQRGLLWWDDLGLSPRKKRQLIVNEVPEKIEKVHCKGAWGGGGGGCSSKCATGSYETADGSIRKEANACNGKFSPPKNGPNGGPISCRKWWKGRNPETTHPRVFLVRKRATKLAFWYTTVHKCSARGEGRWFVGRKGAFVGVYWFCGGPFQ